MFDWGDNSSYYTGTNISSTTASTDEDSEDTWRKPFDIAVVVVIYVIFVVGIIGNSCVITAVVRYRSMRTAPNLFIVNLSVGDMLLLIISLPPLSIYYLNGYWPFGEALCKIIYFIKTLSLGLSVFTLTALSIDRVLVISQTLRFQQKATVRITSMVVTVWILSIVCAIPDLFSYFLKNIGKNRKLCEAYSVEWADRFNYAKIHTMARVVIFYAVPLIIIGICYGVMAHLMIKSSRAIPGESDESLSCRRKQINARRKVVKVAIILILVFLICWLPRNVLILLAFHSDVNIPMSPAIIITLAVANCFQFLSSSINPVILYFLSNTFKVHFVRQCSCGREFGAAIVSHILSLTNRRLVVEESASNEECTAELEELTPSSKSGGSTS